jgi:hypothetical protein
LPYISIYKIYPAYIIASTANILGYNKAIHVIKMKRGSKAQLFTLDLLLALIPLTIALGISASAISGMSIQLEDYIIFYSEQRVSSDVSDVLTKSPGEPHDWTISNIQTLGFATHLGEWGCGTGLSNSTLVNLLDTDKLTSFQTNPTGPGISASLQNVSSGKSIRIVVTNTTDTLVDVMGYYPGGVWTVTNNSATINSTIAPLTNAHVSEKPVGIISRTIDDLELDAKFRLSGQAAAIKSTPAVGDLDGNGEREIVVGSENGKVHAFHSNESGNVEWTFNSNTSNSISSPVLSDINNDGELEVIIGDTGSTGSGGAVKGSIYAIDSNGNGLWSYYSNDDIISSPAVADIDADGNMEIVFGGMWQDHNLTVVSHTGTLEWSFQSGADVNLDKFRASPAIGDINGDNTLEIVAGTCNNKLYAFDPGAATPKPTRWTFPTAGHVHSSPSLFDVDSDGSDEIFFVASGTLYALNDDTNNATYLWPPVSGIDSYYSSPAIGDINGDSVFELVVGDRNNKIYAYNAEDGTSGLIRPAAMLTRPPQLGTLTATAGWR